jgi:hypothetical protein
MKRRALMKHLERTLGLEHTEVLHTEVLHTEVQQNVRGY